MVRLANEATSGVHATTGPSITSPSQHDDYFLCRRQYSYPMDDQGVDIMFKCIRSIGPRASVLAIRVSLYQQHARDTFGRIATTSNYFAGMHRFINRKKDVSTFVELQHTQFDQTRRTCRRIEALM